MSRALTRVLSSLYSLICIQLEKDKSPFLSMVLFSLLSQKKADRKGGSHWKVPGGIDLSVLTHELEHLFLFCRKLSWEANKSW